MRAPARRGALGLVLTSILAATLLPRSLPGSTLVDPSARAGALTAFGLRCFAALLAAYLALVFLGLLLSSLRVLPASVGRWVGRRTAGGLAGAIRRLVGLSAVAVGVLPLSPLTAHANPSAPVMAPDDDAAASSPAPRLAPDEEVVPEAPRAPLPPPRRDPPPARPDPRPRPLTVTVRTGDSFWAIAERLTSAHLGRPAGDAEVIEPWVALIDANLDRLVDPADADLLLPGQVLRVPGH